MDYFIFADGYLQEKENNFTYTISSYMFQSLSFIEELMQSNDSYGLHLLDVQHESDETHFIYKREEEYSLLDDVKKQSKPKIWKKKKDWIAYSIVCGVKYEADKGFFVLPIPENFLIGSESLQFIYKATKDMPITGFDPTQLFIHLKRLILYIYSDDSFSDLLEQKEAKTSDKFLVSLANATNYEELLELIPHKQGKKEEKLVPPKEKKSVMFPKVKKEVKQAPVLNEEKPIQSVPQQTINLEPVIEKSVQTRKTKRIHGTNKLIILLSVLLTVSVLMTSYLLIDKLTYPSQVQLLKDENAQLIEKVEKNEEKIKKLEKENTTFDEQTKELAKENKELEEEIETNVSTIKELVNKNDELKKELKK